MTKKILLVEDEALIAESASLLLEDEGYSVTIAYNGLDGLAAARDETPDLIIADYMMPRMNGLEMIETLQQEGIVIPTLIVSSIPQDKLPQQSDRALYDDYLGKPFLDRELLRAVRQLLANGSAK